MSNYTIDSSKTWEYENGFYLTSDKGRIGKILNHYEIYKKILGCSGDIMEFGVFKGNSLTRLLTFRDLLESADKRKIIGFDAFGKFPDELESKRDRDFATYHDDSCGFGIEEGDLRGFLAAKHFTNFELVKGDIMKTLPSYVAQNPNLRIALLHIDVDIYEPSKLILEHLWDKVVSGGIVMLDDYDIIEGETLAVDEFFANKEHITIHKSKYHASPKYIIKP